jgi:hypothetical protein
MINSFALINDCGIIFIDFYLMLLTHYSYDKFTLMELYDYLILYY